ncbi:MAG: VanZ family protein [Polaromonas sp.]|nr:VanZ family protein [Polaromonas sp.]
MNPVTHRTTAWPLALATLCLVVYASLYPFADWRDQGLSPFAFLSAPWPRYWTGFDVGTNLLGYAPLGFLLSLSALRSGRAAHAVSLAAGAAALLSLGLETLQSYLPSRVPSVVDFSLNSAGAWLGALSASRLEKMGVLQRWSDFRARWFENNARGALVLLALWPLALLFPVSVPMGLGQVVERLELALASALGESPFLEWLPVRDIELQPMVPGAQVIAVALGGLIPCLIGYGVIRGWTHRSIFLFWLLPGGMLFTALSAALSYGPVHAWAWFDAPVRAGFLGACLLALLTLWVPPRAATALALLALTVQLAMLNQASASPYLAQTLLVWEQGRFIRFHGLAQWLGWLWPFAALVYVLLRLSRPEGAPDAHHRKIRA